jgi:hypothetical protein
VWNMFPDLRYFVRPSRTLTKSYTTAPAILTLIVSIL